MPARLLIALLLIQLCSAENLLNNADFSSAENDFPTGWKPDDRKQPLSFDSTNKPPGFPTSLRVDIKTELPGRSGAVGQVVKVRPHTRYRLTGWLQGSEKGNGFFQVKRRKGRKELERATSERNEVDWKQVSLTFDSGEADNLWILCRWGQEKNHLGQTVRFAGLELLDARDLPLEGLHEPKAIPTFHSVGLYWKPAEGASDNPCHLSYRAAGSGEWQQGHPLWFDPNHHSGRPQNSSEYRGSIVHLQPDTEYEIRLRLENTGTIRTLTCRTWSEDFRIHRTVTLPGSLNETLVIKQGGSPDNGYVLYTPAAGGATVSDVSGNHESNIRVKAPWVILRGLTLKNAAAHAIDLEDVHHVVIEDCDVSGWGRVLDDGFGANADSAVHGKSNKLSHIVIQHCEFHHPRSHSNSWNEQRTLKDGDKSYHPMGPQGITLKQGAGRYVIRHNHIHSDMDHMFNDAMGEFGNFSFAGFPNRDSDIHDNLVSHCRDDGLEIEGANMNVRVWNNRTDATMMSLAGATTSLGPVYFWRNIALRSRYGPTADWDGTKGGGLVKLGNESTTHSKGRMYIYHNTIYQPTSWPGSKFSSGCRSGIRCTGDSKRQQHIISRNNILHLRRDSDSAINDPFHHPTNDFDYDLYIGSINAREGSEANGIRQVPTYEPPSGRPPALRPGTPGHDAGVRIPNFNDDFRDRAPDIGAVENGIPFPQPESWPPFPPLHQADR